MAKNELREIEQEIAFRKEIEALVEKYKNKKLPQPVKRALEEVMEKPIHVHMAAVVFREGKWFIAQNPILDLSAHGATEKEAIQSLKDMADDLLSDPDIVKKKISMDLRMCDDISLRMIPMTLPVDDCTGAGVYSRENTLIAAR